MRGACALLAVTLTAGCILGVGPDTSEPHRVFIDNYEAHAINATLLVENEGQVVLEEALALPAAEGHVSARRNFSFGPTASGNYVVRVPELGFRENVTMDRGGWGLFVSFTGGGVRVITLHGD